MRKRITLLCLCLLGLILVLISIVYIPNFLEIIRSPQHIRSDFLKKIPLGTNIIQAKKVIRDFGYKEETLDDDENGPRFKIKYGEYQGLPWWVTIYVYFFFNKEGKLIEISVSRFVDAP